MINNINSLEQWIREKHYLSDKAHPVHGIYQEGHIVDNLLLPTEEEAVIRATIEPPFGSVVFKYGKRSFVSACPIGERKLAFKYYHRLNIRRQLGYTLWGTRCMRAWIAARAFQEIGINTAEPIAVFEKKRWGFFADASILVTSISPGVPLPHYFKKWGHDTEKVQIVADNCRQIFELFRKFKIYHRDTAPKNFIVAPDGKVSIIDLDAVHLAVPHNKWQKKYNRDLKRFRVICDHPSHFPELKSFFEDLQPLS